MECITATAAADLPEETPLLDTETLCQEDQEKEDAEALVQMEELLAIQRNHLKVRENHMNLMREALADLGHKRQELVTLKTQVADAVKKNDADAVNNLHIRVTELQESQSKYTDLLHVSTSAAAEAYSASEHANPASSADAPEQCNPETETLPSQEFEGNTLHAAYDDEDDEDDEDDDDAEAEDINSFIAMNLTALLEEINSIDPTTEESSEASEWVSQQRDALIAQLEELQIMSRLEEEKRREQIQVLQEKQDELEGFKAQIEALSTQIEEQNTAEVQVHERETAEDGTLHQDL
ncbi:hypothetical protein HDU80_007947 [Chytriomyces hyalinus]|nr:hypothetical protein HDU80_007947 [Chytriomyces hyalinus]